VLAALRHRIAELEGREAEFLAVERELRASLASDAARLRDVQQQLDGAKAFVHTILDTIPDPIFVKDEHHAWIVLNEAFCGFMGHSREELLGKSDYDFFPKEEADVFWRLDDALFTTGETNENEESFTDRAGDVHVISTKKALCLDAGGNRILAGVIRDITARVRAEEALRRAHEDLERRVQERTGALERANAELRESEERFRATFEQAAVGIAHVSLDGAFLRVNPRLCDIVGYSADELLTRRFADITAPEDLTASYSAAGEVVGGARESHSFDKRYVRKDGSLVWAHVTTTLAHDAAGRPMYLITGIEDISARKAAEAARLDAEEALQQSEAQLRQAQKMEAVGRLASGVAHDFNNLLLVITVCTELARKQPAGVSGLHALLDDTLNAAKRAAGLTRQLLAFSRQQVLQPRVLDLNELVADAVTMLRRLIGEDIELRTALAPGAALVRVDPGQFVQVLMNLSVNARDAMPDGGSVLIETRNLDVDEGAGAERHGVRAGEYWVCAVTDTGCGMDASTRARLFEPFFTTKAPGKGTGLGLSTVYGIVEQSGGAISVHSEVGQGTTFEVYLPRAASGAAAIPAPAKATTATSGAATVLLVDDEATIRNAVRHLLESNGYSVLVANTPEGAVEIAESCADRIDALLTDAIMPRMNGRQVAQRVLALHPETKVVYMSGYAPRDVLDAETTFLQKPFSEEALLEALRA
jgi:two-component system cell cycle sensor histidine kinase/response regulator CckA